MPATAITSQTARDAIEQALVAAITELGLTAPTTLLLEKPAQAERGDLAAPVALQLIRTLTPEQRTRFQNPLQLATAIAETLQPALTGALGQVLAAITVAAPGFINFEYHRQLLLEEAVRLAEGRPAAAVAAAPTSTVIEYVSPNTNKPLHIGHLRNAAIGWSLSQILAAGGNEVQKAIIFNNRGLHIMKSCWGYLIAGRHNTPWRDQACQGVLTDEVVSLISGQIGNWQTQLNDWQGSTQQWLGPEHMTEPRLQKSDHFIGFWYQLAERFADVETVTQQWSEMLQSWEDSQHPQHEHLRQLWTTMNAWFYEGFEATRQRFGFGFDDAGKSYESEIYQKGKDLVVAAADQGIFERLPDGAVKARLETVGLPDKILLRRDGTGIYMTFDIELTRQRTASNAQRLIWIVGVDQQLYFQQLFAVAQLLGYGEQSRYHHLAYGMVRLPEGKMSSRKGRVLYADDILDVAVSQARTIMEETGSREHLDQAEFDCVAEAVGIGAVKWTMLSVDPLSELTFDVATSVSFKGFAGPYVQYTYARCRSVQRQAESSIALDYDVLRNILIQKNELISNPAEMTLLRTLFIYYETVRYSQETLAPHLLCQYLYELCQSYNSFYAQCPIVSDASLATERKQLRLLLTGATASVLAAGMTLLGLTVVERM